MPSPFLPRSGCHVKGRRWRPWFSRSKIAAQKNKRHTKVCLLFFVTAHMFCCLHSRPPQGRGSVRGEPLTGSPTRVQSPARRRPLLRSKSGHPPAGDHFCVAKVLHQKRKTPMWVSFFFVIAHRFCCQLSVVLNLMLKLSPVPPSTTSSMSTQDFNPCALSYIFVMGRHL